MSSTKATAMAAVISFAPGCRATATAKRASSARHGHATCSPHRKGHNHLAARLLHTPRTSSHTRRSSPGQPTAELSYATQAKLDRPLRGSLMEEIA
ncbi:hypothetical protein BDA96_03G172800 [Sorghum bicolor]|uniref:Uncharacterized protein n=2 Tax=Sorghum bicolor TaxID=4558 RepID=A0A921UMJ5_SORBI|nr:hypothetical protein BDA96_03G172800 [Sorghum bicolor]KXG32503.1 hypothetical protein SORBI_3003G163600 [Sorghum bicolor]